MMIGATVKQDLSPYAETADLLPQELSPYFVYPHTMLWRPYSRAEASVPSRTTGTLALILIPYPLANTATFDRAEVDVVTAGIGAVLRAGIYNTENSQPNALVHDFGSVAGDTTGAKTFATGTFQLMPGLYWVGGFAEVASVTVRGMYGYRHIPTTANQANVPGCFDYTANAGAMPTTLGAQGIGAYTSGWAIGLHCVSVP